MHFFYGINFARADIINGGHGFTERPGEKSHQHPAEPKSQKNRGGSEEQEDNLDTKTKGVEFPKNQAKNEVKDKRSGQPGAEALIIDKAFGYLGLGDFLTMCASSDNLIVCINPGRNPVVVRPRCSLCIFF